MQHTEKYQLNLIDPSDEFLPDPLNQNMEAVEAQLQAREAAEKALDSKFTAAVGTKGKTCRIATGQYTGAGKGKPSLTFDFNALVVLVVPESDDNHCILMARPWTSAGGNGGDYNRVTWAARSVSWTNISTSGSLKSLCDEKDVVYHYFAIGTDE